jgi:hypothetical protein
MFSEEERDDYRMIQTTHENDRRYTCRTGTYEIPVCIPSSGHGPSYLDWRKFGFTATFASESVLFDSHFTAYAA